MSSDHNTMTEMEKLAHLLEHWQGHNDEHAANYTSWAEKAEAAGKNEAAAHLREAAEVTGRVTELFAKARGALG